MPGRTAGVSVDSTLVHIEDTQGISQNVVQIEPGGTADTLTLWADVTFSGILAPFIVALGITFQVHYLFSPIGPGGGGEFNSSPVSVTTQAGVLTYDKNSTPSTKLVLPTDAAHLPPQGIYEVAARVSFAPGSPPLSAMTDNEADLEIFT